MADYTPDPPTLSVKKYAHLIKISEQQLMDYGLTPDRRAPLILTRWQRFRRWRQKRASALRMRLASWIAGFDVTDTDLW